MCTARFFSKSMIPSSLLLVPDQLILYLSDLSNSRFRQACSELSGPATQRLDEDQFWTLFSALVRWNNKAFLVTMMKTVVSRRLTLNNPIFVRLVPDLSDIDRRKVISMILPTLTTPEDITTLFQLMQLTEMAQWIPFLLQSPTLPCAFLLLKALRYVEHDRGLLCRTAIFLIKRGDSYSFNLASLIVTSYSLDDIRGTFSLQIPPYQLSRIENSYPAFCQIMKF